MKSILNLSLVVFFGLFIAACSDDSPASVAEGESHVRIRVTGDTLTAPIEIEGKTEGLSFYAASQINVLGFANVQSADGQYEVANFTVTVDTPSTGTYEAKNFDIHISGFVNAEGEKRGYSLRPSGEGGTVEIVELDGSDRLHVKIDSMVSPTQLGAKDLVFHLEAEVVVRD